MESATSLPLFTTLEFKKQLAAGALRWYLSRNNFSGIKLHPKKKEIRAEYKQYMNMRAKLVSSAHHNCYNNNDNDNYMQTLKLVENLKHIIEIYLDGWDCPGTKQCVLSTVSNIKCVICLDNVKINKCSSTGCVLNVEQIIVCSGPASHVYHSNCYLAFLRAEQNNDINKKYKCESDTLCIACYQPICLS